MTQISEKLGLFLLLAAVTTLWLLIVIIWPVGFWHSYDEYVYLALADGMNLDVWLRTGLRFSDSNLGTHPGVPLYLISWLCLRATAIVTWHRDAVSSALANPNAFLLSTRIAAGLITLGAIAGAWRLFASLSPGRRALALGLFFVADPWALVYGLTFLGSETFALPLAVLLFWCVEKVISTPIIEDRPAWFACGVGAAAGILVKLPYISVLVGIIVLVCVRAVRLSAPIETKLVFAARRLAIVFEVFLAVAVGILLALAGWSQFVGLLTVFASYVFNTRTPGGHVFSLQTISDALTTMAVNSPLPALLAITFLAFVYYAWTEWRRETFDDRRITWSLVAIVTFGFTTIAVLSRYEVYYVVAIAAMLPFVWAPMLERKALTIIAAVCVFAAAISTGRSAVAQFSEASRKAAAITADEAKILAMPLGAGEARLWTYRVPSEFFVKEFVLQFGGLQDYIHKTDPIRRDYSSYAHVDRPYRYIVFDRGYYPNPAAIQRLAARSQLLEPNGMKIPIGSGAIYRVLQATIVVEQPQK